MRTLLAVWLWAEALAAPTQDLEQARSAYQFGDYQKVIRLLVPLLYPQVSLTDPPGQAAARKLLGLSYLFERNESAAEREFLALLQLDPDFQLDPLLDPPPFVDFFNRVRAKYKEQLAEGERRRREEEEIRRLAEAKRAEEAARAAAERLEEKLFVWVVDAPPRSRWLALVPFGVGQFQNGHDTKGQFLLWSEAVLAAASLSLALTVRLRYPEGTFPQGDADEQAMADRLVSAQVITGALFFAVAIYGAVDAQYYFVSSPRLRKVPRESLRLSPVGFEVLF